MADRKKPAPVHAQGFTDPSSVIQRPKNDQDVRDQITRRAWDGSKVDGGNGMTIWEMIRAMEATQPAAKMVGGLGGVLEETQDNADSSHAMQRRKLGMGKDVHLPLGQNDAMDPRFKEDILNRIFGRNFTGNK